jgi:hypothetical protein
MKIERSQVNFKHLDNKIVLNFETVVFLFDTVNFIIMRNSYVNFQIARQIIQIRLIFAIENSSYDWKSWKNSCKITFKAKIEETFLIFRKI